MSNSSHQQEATETTTLTEKEREILRARCPNLRNPRALAGMRGPADFENLPADEWGWTFLESARFNGPGSTVCVLAHQQDRPTVAINGMPGFGLMAEIDFDGYSRPIQVDSPHDLDGEFYGHIVWAAEVVRGGIKVTVSGPDVDACGLGKNLVEWLKRHGGRASIHYAR